MMPSCHCRVGRQPRPRTGWAERLIRNLARRLLPDHYRTRLDVPGDYFIEVTAVGPADHDSDDHKEIWVNIESIVARYGSLADEFGAADPDHVPFAWFGDT
jgi:hypothetical protein